MYSQYLLEKEDKETIELRDKGFVTYKVNDDNCHICVIYVKPDIRNASVARQLMNRVIEKTGCKSLTSVCFTKQNGTTDTMKILLHYGFEIVGVQNDDILLYKELK